MVESGIFLLESSPLARTAPFPVTLSETGVLSILKENESPETPPITSFLIRGLTSTSISTSRPLSTQRNKETREFYKNKTKEKKDK